MGHKELIARLHSMNTVTGDWAARELQAADWQAEADRARILRLEAAAKVTESIYDGATVVIPLADVSHVIKMPLGIQVVTKHTTYNFEGDDFNNCAWIGKDEQAAFLAAWCRYRSELEADTLADLTPNAALTDAEGVRVEGTVMQQEG